MRPALCLAALRRHPRPVLGLFDNSCDEVLFNCDGSTICHSSKHKLSGSKAAFSRLLVGIAAYTAGRRCGEHRKV